jgi:hypothetical protein
MCRLAETCVQTAWDLPLIIWPVVRISTKDRRPYFSPVSLIKACHNLYGIKGEINMLFTIAAVLIILWLLGMVTSVTIGGFIHVLLVIAAIVVLIRIIRGK